MGNQEHKIDVEGRVFEQLNHSFDMHTIKIARELLEEARFIKVQDDIAEIINKKVEGLYRERKLKK